jgi:hypothetical protein
LRPLARLGIFTIGGIADHYNDPSSEALRLGMMALLLKRVKIAIGNGVLENL